MRIFKHRRLLWSFFIGYGIVLFAIVFVRNDYTYVDFSGYPYWHQVLGRINLIPFATIQGQLAAVFGSGRRVAVRNLAANLLLFAPMGMFLPMLLNKLRRFGNCIRMWFRLILAIEMIQLLTLQGSFDIDDVILNTLGFFAGYCVFLILKLFVREEKSYVHR